MRQLCLLLRLAPLFIVHSSANAQTPPITPDVPRAVPSVVVPKPDTSDRWKPAPKFREPDGFGGLKEVPDNAEGPPDQTDSVPNQPLSEPTDNRKQ
jgi:hypothetical protein